MRVGTENVHNRWHPDIEPVAWVRPGEIVTLATLDGLAGQLTRDSTHEDCGRLSSGAAHPLTGPIHVDSAEPGDTLAIEILSYETADFGVSCIIPGFGFLSDVFPDPYLLKWDIARVSRPRTRSPASPSRPVSMPACSASRPRRP